MSSAELNPRLEGGASLTGYPAVTPSNSLKSPKVFVPHSSFWYRYLTGNNGGLVKNTCGKWLYYGCLNSKKHGRPVAKNQTSLDGKKASSKDTIKAVRMSCNMLGCPICYEKASTRAGKRVEHRLKQFKWRNRKSTKYYHWTVSPPAPVWLGLTVKQLKKKAISIAKKFGVRGGSVIFHHLRRVGEADEDEDFNAGSDWKTAPALWYLSPHFHFVGVGFTSKKKVIEINKKTGWVCINHLERRSIAGTVFYQLTHAFIPRGRGHAVSWFGVCSYNKFKTRPIPPPETSVCSICKEEMVKVRPVDKEAGVIVMSTIDEEGEYFMDHGLFEVIPQKVGVWLGGG